MRSYHFTVHTFFTILFVLPLWNADRRTCGKRPSAANGGGIELRLANNAARNHTQQIFIISSLHITSLSRFFFFFLLRASPAANPNRQRMRANWHLATYITYNSHRVTYIIKHICINICLNRTMRNILSLRIQCNMTAGTPGRNDP